MSGYLTDRQYNELLEKVSIYRIRSKSLNDLSTYSFDVGAAQEYKTFLLQKAKRLDELAISNTFVMFHNQTGELIGYFTLSADTIKLTPSEKEQANLDEVCCRAKKRSLTLAVQN